ncbi:MAG: InlB B-repeat-containing protein [Christensenellaceae bacterium]|jgi:hypothetical protein
MNFWDFAKDTIDSDITLYSKWFTACDLFYDYPSISGYEGWGDIAKDGPIPVGGESIKLAGELVREGYTFSGWLCSEDGKLYAPGDDYSISEEQYSEEEDLQEEGITFTAKWEVAADVVSLSYNQDGSISVRIGIGAGEFLQLYVDGALVSNENYQVGSGSTVITLKESYIGALSKGKHALEARFMDARIIKQEFVSGSFISGWPENGTMEIGQSITLYPLLPGGQWSFDDSFWDVIYNADGSLALTAKRVGATVVSYTVERQTQSRTITISGNGPNTGDENRSALWIVLLVASAMVCGVVAMKIRRTSPRTR